MKDIDFDELDRAVSSVLTSKDAPVESAAEPVAVKTAAPAPAVDVPAPPAAPSPAIVQSRQTITPSPATRRSGRFMDVVHPSSDMKTASSPATKPRIQPISPTVTPDPSPHPAPVADVIPDVTSPEPETPKLTVAPTEEHPTLDTLTTTPESSTQQAWPDPLSFEENESKDTETVDAPTDVITNPEPVVSNEPSQTPFLADAKVDKRPLGGYEPSAVETSSLQDEVESQGDIGAPVAIVPRELEEDVVTLDANELDQMPAPAPKVEETEPIKEEKAESTTPVATSIPQQYKATESAPDSETHAIFDTDSYHQPLTPPKAGSKRVWIWVLLVGGLLIVGAGLGALWYMAGF